MLAANPLIQDGNLANNGQLLAAAMESLPGFMNVALVDGDGQLRGSFLPTTGAINYTDRVWFQECVRTGEFTLSEYVVGKTTKEPTMPLAFPVKGPDGNVIRILVAGLDFEWIYRLAGELELPEDTSVLIIDRSGNLLVRFPDPEEYIDVNISQTELGQASLRRQSDILHLKDLSGTDRLFLVSPLESDGVFFGSLALGFSRDFVYRDYNRALIINVLLLALAYFLAVLSLGWGLRFLVLNPSRKILDAFAHLSSGLASFRIEPLKTNDEMAQLIEAFNAMASELQGHRQNLEKLIEARTDELERRTVELKRSNEELEQFAYVASHDLQEPLRMVASFTQLLAERYRGKIDEKADEYIHYAVDGAKRMQGLINDLLSYSRVGTKGKPFGKVDAGDVLKQTLEVLEGAIRESGATVLVDPLPAVVCDANQLAQVFQNLIGNAIKYRGEVAPHIEISAREERDSWEFVIKDNGIGIDPQYFDRIFIVFQRLHDRDSYPGNGVGLSIVKKIVERHGGRVWLESEVGKGSIFRFTLPKRNEGDLQ